MVSATVGEADQTSAAHRDLPLKTGLINFLINSRLFDLNFSLDFTTTQRILVVPDAWTEQFITAYNLFVVLHDCHIWSFKVRKSEIIDTLGP